MCTPSLATNTPEGVPFPSRVDELVERVDRRQTRGADLHGVLSGLQHCEVGALDLPSVLAGARQGVLKRDSRRFFGSRSDQRACKKPGKQSGFHCYQ